MLKILISLISFVFLSLIVVMPMWAMFNHDEQGILWQAVFQDDFYRKRMIWTVFQAACSSILALLLALPMAWSLARLRFIGRNFVFRIMMLPFIMPTLVAGMGVLALFGERGILWAGWQDTPYLLIYGNIFFNLPVAILALQQGFQTVPAHQYTLAKTLGANAWQRFYHIDLPVLKNWAWGAGCLIFLYCFSGFGLAILLGGQQYATIEVEIYQLIAYELDMSRASVLVCLMLVITMGLGGMMAWFSRRQHVGKKAIFRQPEAVKTGTQKLILLISLMIIVLFCVLPLLAVAFQAVSVRGQAWRVLWQEETTLALKNTFIFTILTMISSTILGISHAVWARHMTWARGIVFLPMMISPVCLAFGVLLAYSQYSDQLFLLLALYAMIAYPFITKDILAKWDTIPPKYTQMATVMGANRFQIIYRVYLPLLLPAWRRGLTLAAASSIGEFAASLFLARPEWLTLTTLIYQKLGKIGTENYQQAIVLTSILMTLATVIFLLIQQSENEKAA